MLCLRNLFVIVLVSLTMLVGGCAEENGGSTAQQQQQNQQITAPAIHETQTVPGGQSMSLTVYSGATADARYVVGEQRVVPYNDQPARTAVELLLGGPQNKELAAVVPAGTKLKNIEIKAKTAYVDFNDKLVKGHLGASGELLLVAAIVNTLTEFPGIEKVQILVEGKPIDTIAGYVDTSTPFGRQDNMIRN